MGSQSIVFGHDGRAGSLVNCVRVISDSPTRKVFEVLYEGVRAVAKCWIADEEKKYCHYISTFVGRLLTGFSSM